MSVCECVSMRVRVRAHGARARALVWTGRSAPEAHCNVEPNVYLSQYVNIKLKNLLPSWHTYSAVHTGGRQLDTQHTRTDYSNQYIP